MTVAIKRENGDLIWFDAILQLSRTYTGSVSKHPLESGAVVSDHVTKENPIITISGVISDVDFNLNRPVITASDAANYNISNKQFVNNTPVSATPVITPGDNALRRLLPESVAQFLDEQPAGVVVPEADRPKFAAALESDLTDMWSNTEEFELIDFEGNRIDTVYNNCVITSLSFKEDPDSGDALWPELTIEQVTFAESTSVAIPQRVAASIQSKASPTNGKGNQNTTKQESDTPDVKKDGSGFSNTTAQDVNNNEVLPKSALKIANDKLSR